MDKEICLFQGWDNEMCLINGGISKYAYKTMDNKICIFKCLFKGWIMKHAYKKDNKICLFKEWIMKYAYLRDG